MLTVHKLTPVLFASEIEPCLRFWTERLGFEKTVAVPEGDKLGFAILQKGNIELMYQSYASAGKDLPAVAEVCRQGPSFLYVEVAQLEPVLAALQGVEVVVPLRSTFYGSKEMGVKDPAGHIVVFAQPGAATGS